jgi:hypothetical protein
MPSEACAVLVRRSCATSGERRHLACYSRTVFYFLPTIKLLASLAQVHTANAAVSFAARETCR